MSVSMNRKPNPQQIGKALKAAGLAKAGRYVPYGHRDPGYQLSGSYDGTVSVLPIADRQSEKSKIAHAAESALREAGFNVERSTRWDEHDRHESFFLRVL